MKQYDPAVREFMKMSAQLLRKGYRKKDPALMWAILVNISGVIDTVTQAAEEQHLVAKLSEDIKKHEEEKKKFKRAGR